MFPQNFETITIYYDNQKHFVSVETFTIVVALYRMLCNGFSFTKAAEIINNIGGVYHELALRIIELVNNNDLSKYRVGVNTSSGRYCEFSSTDLIAAIHLGDDRNLRGDKIQWIKSVRLTRGLRLFEAKTLVEFLKAIKF